MESMQSKRPKEEYTMKHRRSSEESNMNCTICGLKIQQVKEGDSIPNFTPTDCCIGHIQ